jgi:hypothetical protein
VAVNGQVLFDDEVEPRSHWSADLPLTGVPLGEQAVIELGGSTFVPAETTPGSKDPRRLGVRVERLVLNDEAAPEAR